MSANPIEDGWSEATLRRRVLSRGRRREGSAPDPREVEAYASALPPPPFSPPAVVLGMTPELRNLAAARTGRVLVVDRSAAAIELYRDWLEPAWREREVIAQADWSELPHLVPDLQVVLADAACNNLDRDGQRRLLTMLRGLMRPEGRLIARQVAYPPALVEVAEGDRAERVLQQYREGRLSDAEFGHGLRFTGFLATCWDRASGTLRNALIFDRLRAWHGEGRLTASEWAAVEPYAFPGNHWVLAQPDFEALLNETGWRFERIELSGRNWYSYYPLYVCTVD